MTRYGQNTGTKNQALKKAAISDCLDITGVRTIVLPTMALDILDKIFELRNPESK